MLIFQGHDTTAAAMNWAVFLISSNTRIQQKLHEELDSVFGKNFHALQLSWEDILQLKPDH